jgi:hypothetical protein
VGYISPVFVCLCGGRWVACEYFVVLCIFVFYCFCGVTLVQCFFICVCVCESMHECVFIFMLITSYFQLNSEVLVLACFKLSSRTVDGGYYYCNLLFKRLGTGLMLERSTGNSRLSGGRLTSLWINSRSFSPPPRH